MRLALSTVKIIESKLTGFWIDAHLELESGEIDYNDDAKDFKRVSFPVETNGIKTKYLIEKINDGSSVSEYLCILFNSKLLGSEYLNGINQYTVVDIYNSLINQNIVFFSFENFIKAKISDIDIKTDFNMSIEAFDHLLTYLNNNTVPRTEKDFGNRVYRRTDNMGIEWSDRRKSTEKSPYVKFYHKSKELIYNSDEFYKNYFQNGIQKDLIRLEFTIKGKKHLKRLVGKSLNIENTLQDLFYLTQDEYKKISIQILKKHIKMGENMKNHENNDKITPLEIVLSNVIAFYQKNGMSITETVIDLTKNLNKQQKYDWKIKLQDIYKNYSFLTQESISSEFEVIDFLETLGIAD